MTDTDGRLFAEKEIDEQADRAIADQQHGFREPVERATTLLHDKREEEQDALREIAELEEQDGDLQEREQELGERHGPGPFGYAALLITCFLMLLPADLAAAQGLPIAPAMQTMLAILAGAIQTWAAHYAGRKLEDLHEAHGRRDDDPFQYKQEQILLGAAIAIPIATIIGFALWRANTFATDARITGGLAQGGMANIALAFLALVGFTVAVIASLAHRRMQPLRQVRKERGKNFAKRKQWQRVADEAQRIQAMAQVTLDYLAEREAAVVEAIHHWAEERKNRVRHLALNKERKIRAKRGWLDNDGPGEAAAVPARPGPRPPRPIGDGHVRPLDLAEVADRVRTQANGRI